MKSDQAVSAEQRDRLARAYADRAMKLLHVAVSTGLRDQKDLHDEPAFSSLRERDDFSELLRGLKCE